MYTMAHMAYFLNFYAITLVIKKDELQVVKSLVNNCKTSDPDYIVG